MESQTELATLIAAADACLDGVILCEAQAPHRVIHASKRTQSICEHGENLDSAAQHSTPTATTATTTATTGTVTIESVGDASPNIEANNHSCFIGQPLELALASLQPALNQLVRDAIAHPGEPVVGTLIPEADLPLARVTVSTTVLGPLVWISFKRSRDTRVLEPERNLVDELTGLGSRIAVRQAIHDSLDRLTTHGTGFSLLFFDIDELRRVNERHGPEVGDQVLGKFGERLQKIGQTAHFVGRLGDDDFVLLWPGCPAATELQELYSQIAAELSRPMRLEHHIVRLTVSAGAVVISEPSPADPDAILADAETALMNAKGTSPGQLVFFSPAMRTLPPRRLLKGTQLRAALANDELRMFAQPMVRLATGEPAGAELLIRWRHPKLGWLSPDAFLDIAEASDMADLIGNWVIDRSVALAGAWQQQLPASDYRLGINITPRQLALSHVYESLLEALERHGARADQFVIELIESTELASRPRAAAQLAQLRELGARIAVDDFGTGFANMSYLRDLPIDVIKVDRTLVGAQPTTRERAIVSAVVQIAEAIDAKVVLEGIEYDAQVRLAREVGVTFGQGYLIGTPDLVSPSKPPPLTSLPQHLID